jgi:hypothetical protein
MPNQYVPERQHTVESLVNDFHRRHSNQLELHDMSLDLCNIVNYEM